VRALLYGHLQRIRPRRLLYRRTLGLDALLNLTNRNLRST